MCCALHRGSYAGLLFDNFCSLFKSVPNYSSAPATSSRKRSFPKLWPTSNKLGEVQEIGSLNLVHSCLVFFLFLAFYWYSYTDCSGGG